MSAAARLLTSRQRARAGDCSSLPWSCSSSHDGGYGYDAYAYWLAGRNVLDGNPLYWLHDEGALGAYRYPPLFAQLWAPFTLMPALAFSWVWRGVCLLCLRYLAGSWRNVGLWGLVPLTWTELSIANITFPTAALTVLALRGRAEFAAWAGALKIAPLLALPYFWISRPETRRALLIGAGHGRWPRAPFRSRWRPMPGCSTSAR